MSSPPNDRRVIHGLIRNENSAHRAIMDLRLAGIAGSDLSIVLSANGTGSRAISWIETLGAIPADRLGAWYFAGPLRLSPDPARGPSLDGALGRLRLSRASMDSLVDQLRQGSWLIAAHTSEARVIGEARRILTACGANGVTVCVDANAN
jgi:hypothetical protein